MNGDGREVADPAVPVGLLESFLPRDRRAAIAEGREIPERVDGAGLFADISGFTALSEALVAEHGRHRGAEELDRNLNRVYEAIIDDLADHRGEVLYFSGDAITCWLKGDDGSRAVQCALDMQRTMASVGGVETAAGTIELSIKIAVATGSARRFVVGDPELQLMDVLAGSLIDHLAAAEGLTERGEVMADESVVAVLGERLVWSEQRREPTTGHECVVVERLEIPPPELPVHPLPSLEVEQVRPWLLPDIFQRLVIGGGVFLGELRNAHPIFVRFGGFDFDDDPQAAASLDGFVRAVQEVVHRYEGTLLGITVGDKGAYLNAVMGAPRSHEDDAQRAVAAAVEIRDLERTTGAIGIQVGVSVGQIYSGTYGHTNRRTYSVLGDPTNLAARLMSAAPAGEVYVLEEVAAAVADRFVWAELPPLTLKGKSIPVRARAAVVARRQPVRRVPRYPLPMVGRDRELALAFDRLQRAGHGERHVLAIAAEAGMGKSRFVAEILRAADRSSVRIGYGQAESLGRSTSYTVWRGIWRRLFRLDDELPDAQQAQVVEVMLRSIDPLLARRAPLLGVVLGIEMPDNDFVRHFDAKLRKTSLENLLADVLIARAADGPLLLVLEDLQWIDQPSIDLLAHLVRRTAGLSILCLLSYRHEPGDELPPEIRALPDLDEIVLGELDEEGVRSVVASKVTQVFGADVVASEPLVELVLGRADGNPFYAEELVNYVQRLGLDPSDPEVVSTIALPDSLNSILLSRIDGLDELPRQALKVASVVGREFDASMLGRVHRSLGEERDIVDLLQVGRAVDLVTPRDEELLDWLFRHIITREVAYESIPHSIRSVLHERIGDAIVEVDGETALADLLAHHYWHSENVDKQRRFLRLAGDASRKAYANEAAIEHYRRLAVIVEGHDRVGALLDLAGVHELVGDWDEAESTAGIARELAVEIDDDPLVASCDVALAEIDRKQGRLDEAIERLRAARRIFDAVGDDAGVAKVLHVRGTIAAQQGDLDEARLHYVASREVRERTGDLAGLAGLLSNLGVVAEYEADFEASERFHRHALDLRRELGDRWAIAVSHTNLGMIAFHQGRFDEARELFDEAMRLNIAVGDTWMVAIAHNNLGNAARGLGDRVGAWRHYLESLSIAQGYSDRWALAFLFEDIAQLVADDDPEIALQLLGVADRWRDEIGVPRPASLEEGIETRLRPHVDAMPTGRGDALRSGGRSWTDVQAFERAERVCRTGADPG